jgi:hypothetical protein
MDVRLPDGTLIQNVPDGTTKADLAARLKSNGMNVPDDWMKPEPTLMGEVKQGAGNLLAGAVRGAGSIGATLLAPVDIVKDAIDGKGLSLESNRQRRSDMDAGLQTLGAEPDSLLYKGGKLTGEIAGTAGAGGVLANGVRAAGATRALTGLEPITNGIARGLETGGFRVGDLAGTGLGAATRVATGAATGGVAAGMVNPSDAGVGAVIGGALPGATAVAGRAGAALRGGGPTPTPEMLGTARRAMADGYVIPPSMINPSFGNRFLESQSGKFETAQLAATRNQDVTNRLVRQALGLAPDAPLTQETMRNVRRQAAQAYEQIRGTGVVAADQEYNNALNAIGRTVRSATASFPALGRTNMHGQPLDDVTQLVDGLRIGQFDASGAVDTISFLRDQADDAFRAGNNALGRASRAGAAALENMLDRHLQAIGANDLLPAYRDARRLIARSYTAEKGLREGAGTVDARALARELQNGKPLTDELRTVAEFGNTFNKAAQPPHLIGSPGVNTLKNTLAILTGGAGAAAMGPAGVSLAALNYLVPPAARSIMFSPRYQQRLLNVPNPAVEQPLGRITQGAARSFPLFAGE